MKKIYGWLLFIWLATELIIKCNTDLYSIASFLGALCLFIIKEKYLDKSYVSILFLFLILVLSRYNFDFILLVGIPLVDFAYLKNIPLSLFIFTVATIMCITKDSYNNIFYLLSATLWGYITGDKLRKETAHIITLDEERRLRYKLELAQKELISSKKEIEYMTEIRERNRIAHEIHDNIGHGIAGVIFQIEAARRIIKKDTLKTEEILKLCSEKLAETLELARNSIYNIKTDKIVGIQVIDKVIKGFNYCPVEFKHTGDFNTISVSNMKILEASIMEFLTNASKHSHATNIEIRIDLGKRNIRLYCKDNGIGCRDIKENLGISGMRDRVRNVGGTISIDGKDGFLIVCNLPSNSFENR
jgi:signal transduction histidine kinase